MIALATSDAASAALAATLADARLVPSAGPALWRNARDPGALLGLARERWLLQQDFKPFADALEGAGFRLAAPAADETFGLVCLTPPRQRALARAQLAQSLEALADGGTLIVAAANNQGARSLEADFAALCGAPNVVSRRKCRVAWRAPAAADIDRELARQWRALDAPVTIVEGRFWSRPGLFAWDHIDAASALLAAELPSDLGPRVADLGAGFGYLAVELLRRCPRLEVLDLYEADRRALEPARRNLARVLEAHAAAPASEVLWHDVSRGLERHYDAIVSNPPFHVDRRDRPELGRAFIDAAADALSSDGRLLIVANRHLPYEAALRARFAELAVRAERDGFKVLAARGPKRR